MGKDKNKRLKEYCQTKKATPIPRNGSLLKGMGVEDCWIMVY